MGGGTRCVWVRQTGGRWAVDGGFRPQLPSPDTAAHPGPNQPLCEKHYITQYSPKVCGQGHRDPRQQRLRHRRPAHVRAGAGEGPAHDPGCPARMVIRVDACVACVQQRGGRGAWLRWWGETHNTGCWSNPPTAHCWCLQYTPAGPAFARACSRQAGRHPPRLTMWGEKSRSGWPFWSYATGMSAGAESVVAASVGGHGTAGFPGRPHRASLPFNSLHQRPAGWKAGRTSNGGVQVVLKLQGGGVEAHIVKLAGSAARGRVGAGG